MRCLVTGAAGFIGSSLCDRLLADGHEVRGVDCFLDYYPRAMKEKNLVSARADPRFDFREASLVDADLRSLCDGVAWIFHQAAQSGVRSSWGRDFQVYSENNVYATQRLLEVAHNTGVAPLRLRLVVRSLRGYAGSPDAGGRTAGAGLSLRGDEAGCRTPLLALLEELRARDSGPPLLHRCTARGNGPTWRFTGFSKQRAGEKTWFSTVTGSSRATLRSCPM